MGISAVCTPSLYQGAGHWKGSFRSAETTYVAPAVTGSALVFRASARRSPCGPTGRGGSGIGSGVAWQGPAQ
ncbi:hypothetical protein ABZ434_09170 [Streptomyces sp. NPDC005761]